MARGRSTQDATTLQMALVGYHLEKQKIEAKIEEIQGLLGGKKASAGPKAKGRKRRKLSAAARHRIAVAQKRRWAEHRKKMAAKG